MEPIAARGFVLDVRPQGESDKIVQIYSPQLGSLKAVAKGARKPKSKLAPGLEIFTESGFSLFKKRAGNFYVLGQVKVLDGHGELKKDLPSITALQVLADMMVQSLHDAQPHPELYSLLKETLEALGEHPTSREILLTAFGVKFIDLLGHPLELEVCVECGGSLAGPSPFLIPHRGGALCGDCCPSGPGRLKVSAEGLGVLKKLRTLPMGKVQVLKMKPTASRAIFLAVLEYLERTIERRLRSVEYYLTINSKY